MYFPREIKAAVQLFKEKRVFYYDGSRFRKMSNDEIYTQMEVAMAMRELIMDRSSDLYPVSFWMKTLTLYRKSKNLYFESVKTDGISSMDGESLAERLEMNFERNFHSNEQVARSLFPEAF